MENHKDRLGKRPEVPAKAEHVLIPEISQLPPTNYNWSSMNQTREFTIFWIQLHRCIA